MPPTLFAMTGTPAAIASNRTSGVPSVRELMTRASKALRSNPAFERAPCHRTRFSRPRFLVRFSSSGNSGPVPMKLARQAGAAASASRNRSGPFSPETRPTQPASGPSPERPSARRASSLDSGLPTGAKALGMTESLLLGIPLPSSSLPRGRETATTRSNPRRTRRSSHS